MEIDPVEKRVKKYNLVDDKARAKHYYPANKKGSERIIKIF